MTGTYVRAGRTAVLVVGPERPTYEREAVNTRRATPPGLHPSTATQCLTLRQVMRKDYGWTIEHWNELTDEYKTWWARQCKRLGVG